MSDVLYQSHIPVSEKLLLQNNKAGQDIFPTYLSSLALQYSGQNKGIGTW